MNTTNSLVSRCGEQALERVIEPLTSYICAADQPKAVLNRVVAALFQEVARTNRLARAHVARRPSLAISK